MDKLEELKEQLRQANKKLFEAIGKEDLAGAKEQRSIMAGLTKKIENEKADIEKRSLQKQKEEGGKGEMEKRSYKKAIKELKEGKIISTRAIVVNGESTQAVVPEEFLEQVEKLEDGYGSLENYCEVIPVSAPQGKRPVSELGGKLTKLTPGQKLPEGSLEFEQLTYDAEAYGEIVAVDNSLDEDSAVDLFSVIKENYAIKSVNTKNEEILKAIEGNKNSSDLSIAGAEDLIGDIINKIDAYSPAVRRFVKVLADSGLRAKIKNSFYTESGKDERITVNGDKVYIDGHEVVEFDETLAPEGARGYIAPMKSIKFFKRKGMEIATSSEVYFDSNATAIRVVERFDVKALENEKVKATKIVA